MSTPAPHPANATGAVTGTPTPPPRTANADPSLVQAYTPPRLTRLGTLTELTRGGNVSAQSDGIGFAGGSGVV
jgi:hypothetical protein